MIEQFPFMILSYSRLFVKYSLCVHQTGERLQVFVEILDFGVTLVSKYLVGINTISETVWLYMVVSTA